MNKEKRYLIFLIALIIVVWGASYLWYNSNSTNNLTQYNKSKNETNSDIQSQDKVVNNSYNVPEYNSYDETIIPSQEHLICSYEQIKFNDWDACLDIPSSEGVFNVGILIDTKQTQVSDSNLNQVVDIVKSKLKELSGIDLKIQEIVRKDLSLDLDEDFAEAYIKETNKIPEGLIILGVENSKVNDNTGGYSSSYCLWESKTDKLFTNEFHSPFLKELRYDYCFVLAFIDWNSYYPGDSSDKYGEINYYHASGILHEIMHFYGENGNYDHYGTEQCNKMSYISKEDTSLSKSQDYMVICPSLYFNLKPRIAGEYCSEEGINCYSNQDCCNGAICCQSKGLTCQYSC